MGEAPRLSFPARHPVLACGLLGLVLVGAFLEARALPLGGSFIGGIDVKDHHYWCIRFFKDHVLSGTFPLWNPHMYSGHPFAANPANFVFYPPIALYVIFPLAWAFNIDLVLHLLACWVGMYALARRMTGSSAGALTAALVYTFNGQLFGRIYGGHLTFIHSAAIIPFVFLAMERVFEEDRPYLFALAGALLGLLILTGNTQIIFYVCVLLCLYLPVRYVSRFGFSGLKRFAAYCLWFLLVPAVSFGVSAVFLLPVAEFIALSDRAEKTYEFAVNGSFGGSLLYTLLVPHPETRKIATFWELGGYCGVIALALAGIGVFSARHRRKAWVVALLLAVTMTFVLGRYTPLYRLYYEFIPLLGNFRVPARALTIAVFFLSLLVSFGASYLWEERNGKKIALLASCSGLVLAALLAFGPLFFDVPPLSPSMTHAYAFVFLGSAAVASLALRKWKVPALALVLFFMFADLFLVYAPGIPVIKEAELTRDEDFEKVIAGPAGDYRVMVPISLNPERWLSPLASRCNVKGYENAGGYVQAAVMDYYRFVHAMAGVEPPVMTRHTLGMDIFTEGRVFSSKILGVKYAVAMTGQGWQLLRADWYMPRARLVHKVKVVPDYRDHLAILKDPGFDPLDVVLLEKADPGHLGEIAQAGKDAGPADSVRMVSYGPDRMEIEASSPSASYLLLSELYYPGWKAYVDGKRAPVLRADYLLRAVPLRAGTHAVTMVYRPASFMAGLAVTLVTLVALTACLVWAKRRPSAEPEAAAAVGLQGGDAGAAPREGGPQERRRGGKRR